MNILFYCPLKFDLNSNNLISIGGIETLNYELTMELAKNNHNIYLATDCDRVIKKHKITNLPLHEVLSHSNNYEFNIIVSSNEPKIFNYYQKTKNILWMHNTLSMDKAFRKKKLLSILKNKITTIFVSKYLKMNTSNFFLFDRKVVIPNFLSNKFLIKKLNFKRDPIFVWSVQRERGLPETINMWIKDIYPFNKKCKLFIYGINQNKYKYDKKIYRNKNIYFFGRTSKTKLKSIYQKSLAMICLGYDETFCLNALEANACGLPILTFCKTALKDYSKNNLNSYSLSSFNDLSKKILLLSNSKINKKIISDSYKYSKKYHISKIKKNWLDLFKS